MRRVLSLSLVLLFGLSACAPTAPATQPTAAPAAKPTTAPAAKPATAPAAQATNVPAPTGAAATAPKPDTKPTAAPAKPAAAAKPAVPSLRIAILANEGTLQPYTYDTGYPGWNLLHLVYDSVMQLDVNNVPQPLLASEVKINADGSQYDITMRPGIRWHDGRPLTAEDVKFTYDYFLANPHSRFTTPLRAIESTTVNGDRVTIKLKSPQPSFPIRALADVPIMPKHLWESVPGAKTKEALITVGSGPFKLVEATPDQVYRMRANEDYFLGAPPVNELILPVIKELNGALQALRSGEVDMVSRELPPEQIQPFSQAPFKVTKGAGFAPTMLQFNAERPPFDRKEVRQAIDLAIDKAKLIDTLLLGNGTPASPGFIHPQSLLYDQSLKPRFDLARAKQLLDGIGATPGPDGIRVLDGKPMTFTILAPSYDPLRVRAGELMLPMLRELGIQGTVTALERTGYISKIWPDFDITKGRDYEMAVWGWSAPVLVDPVRAVDVVHSDPTIGTINVGGYKNPEVDRVGVELRAAVDEGRRKELASRLQQLIAEDVPFVMAYFPDMAFAYRPQAYDGWVFQKGQGVISKLSFLPNFGR